MLSSKSTDLNINLIQNHLHRNTQNNDWAPCGPVKLTHKMNNHSHFEINIDYKAKLRVLNLR